MVGVDFPDIDDVVIIGHPPHVNDYLQKIGCAGRNCSIVPKPRGITYITSHARRAAYENLGIRPPTVKPKGGQVNPKPPKKPRAHAKKHKKSGLEAPSTSKSLMSVEMAQLIISECKTNKLDEMYKNPTLHPSTQCNCSDFIPESKIPKKSPQRQPKGGVRFNLTKEMKELAMKRLIALREEIYIATNLQMLTNPFLVLPRFLPDSLISKTVSELLHLTQDTLNGLIGENGIIKAHASMIWIAVLKLQTSFNQQLRQKVDEKKNLKVKNRYAYCSPNCQVCG